METKTEMNELELFQKYLKIENELRMLKFDPNSELESELNDELESLKDELENIENNEFSIKAKNAILSQIDSYIDSINRAIPGLKLLRDQSMMHRDTLFGNILKDIRTLMTEKIYGFQNPVYLHYTTDEREIKNNNTVEISDLSSFLRNEKNLLTELQNINFISLNAYYEDLRTRIIEHFKISN